MSPYAAEVMTAILASFCILDGRAWSRETVKQWMVATGQIAADDVRVRRNAFQARETGVDGPRSADETSASEDDEDWQSQEMSPSASQSDSQSGA